MVHTNGIRIHLVEKGDGPLVLLVHGFPESWYSWRHQIPALANAGFRVVAVDVRGYGRSSKPEGIEPYRMMSMVGDAVGVVESLGHHSAVIVGHDWGAPIAATSALLRPDLFRGVALLSVPYSPAGKHPPTSTFAKMGGDEEFYINYFQHPGRAEAEIEEDVAAWLRGIYVAGSGAAVRPRDGGFSFSVPKGGKLKDRWVIPDVLPKWLTEKDLDFYVLEFEHSGFTGPLNRYRNIDRDWEDLRALGHRAAIEVPSLFIGGELDGPTMWGKSAIERFPQTLPECRGVHILPGCGHWVQQERAEETNSLLIQFLKDVKG